nr:ERBB-3 binding protein 1 [Tanacetum cinerariifolium]
FMPLNLSGNMGYFGAGDFIACIKFTLLAMASGSNCITSHSLEELQPNKTVDGLEVKACLALPVKSKKKGGGEMKNGNSLAGPLSVRLRFLVSMLGLSIVVLQML